ncbi:MAG: SgcJ/EcaC family oxidoreductase [Arthrobacter sp.]
MDNLDLAEVQKLYEGFIAAWNRRDARAMAERFRKAGVQIGFDGSTATGPDEIFRHLDPIFRGHETATYVAKVRDVRRLGPDTALLTAITGLVPPGRADVSPATNAHQTLIAVREDGLWGIELFQNTPAQFHGRPELVNAMTAELQQLLPK